MLTTKMDLIFFDTGKSDGYLTSNILRPPFNFGNGLLFSGSIKADTTIDKFLFEKPYSVVVEFITIEDEAYNAVSYLLKEGMSIDIQLGSKVIGKATLISYLYQSMILSYKRLELFRDLEIRKSDISEIKNVNLLNAKTDTGNTIQIYPQHVKKLLLKILNKEISEEQLLEWVNTIMFTDLFDYCDEYCDCIASILSELEEIDEDGKELNQEKINKYLAALEKNIEV